MIAWLREARSPWEGAQIRQPLLPHVPHLLPGVWRGGAQWALPSTSVPNDLWPKSEVRDSLGKGVCKGCVPGRGAGASFCTSISCLVLEGGTVVFFSVAPKEKSDLIGN